MGGGTDAETNQCGPVQISGICGEDAQEGAVSIFWQAPGQRARKRAPAESGKMGKFAGGSDAERMGHGQQGPRLGGGKRLQMFWHLLGFDTAGQKVQALY